MTIHTQETHARHAIRILYKSLYAIKACGSSGGKASFTLITDFSGIGIFVMVLYY